MRYWTRALALATLLVSVQQAAADLLQPYAQSAASVADSAAGATARVDNPDSSYYNPAATPWIQRQAMGFSLLSTVNSIKYRGTVMTTPDTPGFPNRQGAQGGEVNALPNLFYVAPLSYKWSIGLSITSPFHQSIDYGQYAPTRYDVTEWYLRTVDISPSIGFRFIRSLSVGLGLDIERAAIRFYQVSYNGGDDRPNETNLDDWGYGFNSGVVWEPCDFARFGASYHSGISHRSAGSSKQPGGYSRAKAVYRLPGFASLGSDFKIGQSIHLLGTINYTHWREMGGLTLNTIQNANGTTDKTLFDHLQNSWLFSIGAHYLIQPDLTLKTGVAYDEGAVSDQGRNLVFPDGDHTIASIGANYKINDNVNLDLGYSHIFNHHASIHYSEQNGSTTVTTQGPIEHGADTFAVQLNWLMT